MRNFLQIVFVLLFLLSDIFASDLMFSKKISLKKDEQKEILVKYDSLKRVFKFRWTLYINGGLVIHRSYGKIVAQNVLYQRYQNQSFRLELKTRGADYYNVPYILVKFKKFDFEKKEAIFEIFLSDDKNQIDLKYLKNS